MANIQNKKTANTFQDELDMMFDGINMENYADDLNNDGDELERSMLDTAMVKAVSKSKVDDIDKLLMVAEMERPGPKVVKINIKSEKKHDIDALFDAVSEKGDTEASQAKGKDDAEFWVGEETDNDADDLRSAVRSIAANKIFDSSHQDDGDQRDDFDVFDEYGEIGAFEGEKNASINIESKLTKAAQPESLVDLEKSFGVEFNTLQAESEDFDPFNAATDDLTGPIAQAAPSVNTLSEVQNKLDEYLKLVADKTRVDEARLTSEKSVNAAALEAESAAKNSEVLDSELLKDELQDSPDDGENWFLEPVTALAPEPEMAEVAAENSVGAINPSKDSLAEDDLSEFFVIADDDSELSVPKLDSALLAEAPVLLEEASKNADLSGIEGLADEIAVPVAANLAEPVLNPDLLASKSDSDINPALMVAQISELWAAHNLIKQQMADFTQLKNNVEQLDKIVQLESKERKERKELKKPLDYSDNSSKKVPGLVYVAAGISALSLLLGGGMFAYGVNLSADVKDLKAHIAALEGDLALINQANIPDVSATGSEDLNAAAQMAARVKILGTRTSEVGNAEDFTQELEKQAKPLLPNSVASATLSQDTQIKSDQAIRVIAANNKGQTAAPKGTHVSNQWVANLMSVRQDWYAKSKVSEFAKQGINAVVTPIDVKGETWYILRSSGFATQEQAMQFATKAKQSLHLASILVTQSE